ncbi:hypothetical protein GCWU000342_01571 [Shuttleworthella satelles DSM 14600]|uniref:Uncharacterized protein n=1 Tax=Shuttleworthella satelles DSM 14600 TaxID=626523 RepID=C4GC84_9FIRM|nr:hypothetical protein GCWU000342_01571 [Shuttleworthia satelles DSM 14600]
MALPPANPQPPCRFLLALLLLHSKGDRLLGRIVEESLISGLRFPISQNPSSSHLKA